MDSQKAFSFSQLFSNVDYYKNPYFQKCKRNWDIYLESDESDELVLVEWEEVLLKDFLKHAKESYEGNWRKGLE